MKEGAWNRQIRLYNCFVVSQGYDKAAVMVEKYVTIDIILQ